MFPVIYADSNVYIKKLLQNQTSFHFYRFSRSVHIKFENSNVNAIHLSIFINLTYEAYKFAVV